MQIALDPETRVTGLCLSRWMLESLLPLLEEGESITTVARSLGMIMVKVEHWNTRARWFRLEGGEPREWIVYDAFLYLLDADGKRVEDEPELCECGREPHLCATFEDPAADHGDL